ncbi:MAG TPA: hypothetical protein VD969_14995 [Symbiobacteriaceae bacterium]|nr:hypothetical protein [Symbiobacteriaceae bacterium]
MEDRIAKLEQALVELRAENGQLRQDLADLRERLIHSEAAAVAENVRETDTAIRKRFKGRWTYIVLIASIVVVPVIALTIWHQTPLVSTVIGALNALVVYFIGPGAVRLLAEGLLRAIPGVLLGQTARITVDSMRKKKAR